MNASAVTDVYKRQPCQGNTVTLALATCVKEQLSKCGAAAVHQQMDKVYTTLRLKNIQGDWVSQEIAVMGDKLLPPQLNLADINTFVDDIKRTCDQNDYLMTFAQALPAPYLTTTIRSLQQSEVTVIPELVGFAMALQNLTASFNNNIQWVAEIVDHWKREEKRDGSAFQQGLIFRLKHASVYAPIRKSHQLVRRGKVPGNFCNFHLPFNVLQAVGYNFLKGQKANAAAGFLLARYRPGNKSIPCTGAGPVQLSETGDLIETGFPLAEKWVDLYQTWNLAFGAQLPSFPLYLCKLVIPQVAGYHDDPQKYVWDRSNALMTYLYYSGFAAYDSRGKGHQESVYFRSGWSPFPKDALCHLWGEVNRHSAADYEQRVKDATAHPIEDIR